MIDADIKTQLEELIRAHKEKGTSSEWAVFSKDLQQRMLIAARQGEESMHFNFEFKTNAEKAQKLFTDTGLLSFVSSSSNKGYRTEVRFT